MESKPIYFNYIFKFSAVAEKRFDVQLERETLNLIRTPKDVYPDWADLNFFKCPNCTIVESIVDVVDFFSNSIWKLYLRRTLFDDR